MTAEISPISPIKHLTSELTPSPSKPKLTLMDKMKKGITSKLDGTKKPIAKK